MKINRCEAVFAIIWMLIVASLVYHFADRPDKLVYFMLGVGSGAVIGFLWFGIFKNIVAQQLEQQVWREELEDMQREEEHICCDPFSEEFDH